jgi:hypothetical protein
MKIGIILGLGAAAVAAVVLSAMPQDAKAKTRDTGGDDAMMEAMMKAGTPGRAHKEFAQSAGEWKTVAKTWSHTDPDAAPETSEGNSNIEMIMGGRYMIEKYSGEMPGMGPFEGMGIMAFNNVTSEFEHIWLDSMSTGVMYSSGTETDGVITLTGEFADPMSGEMVQCRSVSTKVSDNERFFEMFCTMEGTEIKMMEITYTR